MSDETAQPLSGVIYTDGGCRAKAPGQSASRGQGGWGLHGYFYEEVAPKTGSGCKKGVPTAKGYNVGMTGKGTVTVKQYVDAFGTMQGESTNQSAELLSAIHAVGIATEAHLKDLWIIGDSEYVVKGIASHMAKWKANQWRRADGAVVANVESWKKLDDALLAFSAQGGSYHSEWVKGHSGNPGNALADRYSRRAVLLGLVDRPLTYQALSEAKGYWSQEFEHHPFLSHPRWYFTTTGEMDRQTEDGRTIYYTGDIRTSEEFIGKPMADASFSVAYLGTDDETLGLLFQEFSSLAKGSVQGLVSADLRTIFHNTIQKSLRDFGDKLIVLDKAHQAIRYIDTLKDDGEEETLLGSEIRPPRLASKAITVMESLELVLNQFIRPTKASRLVSTDITPLLYECKEEKKKAVTKLKASLGTGTSFVEAPVHFPQGGDSGTHLVRLTLGVDLPDRNALAKLASPALTIHVVTWPESQNAFRFATVIATGDPKDRHESVSIWSGPYANVIFIKPASKTK